MKNNEFRTPLIQSGVLLVAIVLIISMVPSGEGTGAGGFIGAAVSGFFSLILFLIALTLAIGVSIAVLIAIFIGAIALQSPERASSLYAETKQRFLNLLQNAAAGSSATDVSDTGISQEDYDTMKNELVSLQGANQKLQNNVSTLNSKNEQLQEDLHGLTLMVDELKESEKKINELIQNLSTKVDEDPDSAIKDQIHKLEEMYAKTNENISNLAGRIESIESSSAKTAVGSHSSGIFQYIESEDDKKLFSDKIQEGVSQELTYAQFDSFLSEALPAQLDKIIKDHPSLTKDYIRSMRK
ncbi:hypothetical protein [Desulfosediminicola sp.]|uniref:hypothetical protein n=1 Tax=Desulfosediminicola sp. TaxID=2886825 RepID=UPI003AF25B43